MFKYVCMQQSEGDSTNHAKINTLDETLTGGAFWSLPFCRYLKNDTYG